MEWMNTKASCASVWPTGNGTGKRPVLGDPCAPGFACYYMHYQNNNYLVGNPNYTTACFRYGISPYLLRISKTLYKAAYGVYSYGGGLNKVFGANLICTRITPNELTRDYEVSFAEIPNSPTTLRDQCIGFVQLEHHFECCAFRSDVGIKTRDPGLLINSCNANVPLFEAEGYPGSFTNSPGAACPAINPGFTTIRAKWTPSNYGANLWQIKRGIPRRVMYAGSGIPIFKFDLLNMENIVNSNPGAYQETFKATTFLEHYYRYYFGLTTY
jgi:hypothetical protein